MCTMFLGPVGIIDHQKLIVHGRKSVPGQRLDFSLLVRTTGQIHLSITPPSLHTHTHAPTHTPQPIPIPTHPHTNIYTHTHTINTSKLQRWIPPTSSIITRPISLKNCAPPPWFSLRVTASACATNMSNILGADGKLCGQLLFSLDYFCRSGSVSWKDLFISQKLGLGKDSPRQVRKHHSLISRKLDLGSNLTDMVQQQEQVMIETE